MSYILDALRKSDQQRQRGAAPTLLTAQTTVSAPKQPAISLNGWLALILVGAGILIGWWRPWQTESSRPSPLPSPGPIASLPHPTEPIAPEPPLALPQAGEMPVAQSPERETPTVAPLAPTPEAASAVREAPAPARHEPPAAIPKPGAAPVAAQREAAPPVPAPPTVATSVPAVREKPVMALDELPASVRQAIPKLTISFHVYTSNSEDRRVMINNQMLRQGEFIAPGMVAEEITPDGVVVSYKGYRFKQGVR